MSEFRTMNEQNSKLTEYARLLISLNEIYKKEIEIQNSYHVSLIDNLTNEI